MEEDGVKKRRTRAKKTAAEDTPPEETKKPARKRTTKKTAAEDAPPKRTRTKKAAAKVDTPETPAPDPETETLDPETEPVRNDTGRLTANQQAAEILAKAEARGVQSDFFFKTTFQRYLVQLRLLGELDTEIQKQGVTVSKEYVKGRQNIYTNPAVTEYNKTATAANATVSTLINIIKSLTEEDPGNGGKLKSLMEQLAGEAD